MRLGEDVLFNLRFFTSSDKRIALTTTLLYIYEIREGSAIGIRSRDASRSGAECILGVMEVAASVRDGNAQLAAGMTRLMRSQMVPLTSRVLSAGLRRCDYYHVRRRLMRVGALPYSGGGCVAGCINAMYRSMWLYRFIWPLFRCFFEPFVLPRIPKG
ncbi:MAG: hypothetical protein NC406_02925 [Bacteroides sp.]|nr:hypothetical protein [Bacteroides sp.]MCM1095020.1 hypothetical protein [Terasakiella sp.]